MKKPMAMLMFALTLTILPMLSNLAMSKSQAWAIAGIWSEYKVLQTGAVVIETAAGAAFALGAICPPQWVGFAVVGA